MILNLGLITTTTIMSMAWINIFLGGISVKSLNVSQILNHKKAKNPDANSSMISNKNVFLSGMQVDTLMIVKLLANMDNISGHCQRAVLRLITTSVLSWSPQSTTKTVARSCGPSSREYFSELIQRISLLRYSKEVSDSQKKEFLKITLSLCKVHCSLGPRMNSRFDWFRKNRSSTYAPKNDCKQCMDHLKEKCILDFNEIYKLKKSSEYGSYRKNIDKMDANFRRKCPHYEQVLGIIIGWMSMIKNFTANRREKSSDHLAAGVFLGHACRLHCRDWWYDGGSPSSSSSSSSSSYRHLYRYTYPQHHRQPHRKHQLSLQQGETQGRREKKLAIRQTSDQKLLKLLKARDDSRKKASNTRTSEHLDSEGNKKRYSTYIQNEQCNICEQF